MTKKEEIKHKELNEEFLNLYNKFSNILQESILLESEVSIYNLRKLLNTILINSKAPETKIVLKDMLKVLTKMEMSNLLIPNIRKVSDKTITL